MVLVYEVSPTSRSALVLATSSWISRTFSPKWGLPSRVWGTQHSCPPFPAILNAQQCKIKAQQSAGSLLKEEEAGGRSRPAAAPCPAVPGDGLAWALQEHGSPETIVLIMGRLCWRGAASDNSNHHHSHCFIWSHRAQNVKIITGTSCEHLRFSLHEVTRFCCCFWKKH